MRQRVTVVVPCVCVIYDQHVVIPPSPPSVHSFIDATENHGKAASTYRSSSGRQLGEEVTSALKEITSLLNTVVHRVQKVENELKCQKTSTSSSSSDSTPTRLVSTLYLVSLMDDLT